ncbi:fumarylacetoacetate hydrolase family protein [Desulfoluna spongiiphila]|uniref:2-keto-4-pentenoate hydratase/2-oxohepta-3-ene-1,7-dioic acid hydratase (Catechol pathway) n=1 Tax=Desulfoluna spongiiphila TaxID=419481 RepID=A0A1G5BN46_9BACT|nr:fumarylacetoacetate hydrolase family protein [Desulfoluna spongiiphila]SCX91642.1 2-keto-4-pentenoate hydratase/2-oxohepta-3-ene-1,7-dioic acid hydratase (catechol pathway) [Desulfoluna spongiiphila]
MKLSRLTRSGSAKIHACNGEDRWVCLPDEFQSLRLVELLGQGHRKAIDEVLRKQPRADVPASGLDTAASVAGEGGDIWGAGLNYRGHAKDLDAAQPVSGPGSYLRPTGCLIANGEDIRLPRQSKRVTAEGELGLVIGTRCKNVARENWRDAVVAVTTVLDMTAEDVIRENPRYIPWAKGFDTFCSIGPALVSIDTFAPDELKTLRVSTVRNGETIASAQVSEMRYDLGFLVEYFSAGRTLLPGTVICTGTPGAAAIEAGDTVEAMVEQVGHLSHNVK